MVSLKTNTGKTKQIKNYNNPYFVISCGSKFLQPVKISKACWFVTLVRSSVMVKLESVE
jgi:hypothetical protein